jgi:predicted aminopeptidase
MKKTKVTTCTSIYRYTEYEIEVPDDFPDVIDSKWESFADIGRSLVLWNAIQESLGKNVDEDIKEEWIVD